MEDEFDRIRRQEAQPDIGSDLELYMPSILRLNPRIPHYYGDAVRKCFLLIACGLIFLAPVVGGYMPSLLPIAIVGAVILVCLAALTNPRKQWVMGANALTAGVGLIFAELIALMAYGSDEIVLFLTHQAIALVFLFALYFSMKTLRAMMLGTIGRRGRPSEIVDRDKQMRLRHIRSFTDSAD